MVEIPEDQVNEQTLRDWYMLKEQLEKVKAQELILRNRIYKHYFVAKDENGVEILPKEGTNKYDLDDNYKLSAQRVVNRTVDPGTLDALKAERRELEEAEVLLPDEKARLDLLRTLDIDNLIKYEPKLNIRSYRTLTQEQLSVFDTCLIVKDGTPQLDIVLPKRK